MHMNALDVSRWQFGITTVGAVAWGISVQGSAKKTADAGAAAAVKASAPAQAAAVQN